MEPFDESLLHPAIRGVRWCNLSLAVITSCDGHGRQPPFHYSKSNRFCADEANSDYDIAGKMYVLGFLGAINMNAPRDPKPGLTFLFG
jgi:hypothetical protein